MLTIAIGGCSGESKLDRVEQQQIGVLYYSWCCWLKKRLDRVTLRVRSTDARERRAGRVSHSPMSECSNKGNEDSVEGENDDWYFWSGRRKKKSFRKRGISLVRKMMMSKASTYKLRKRTCSLEDGGDFDSAEPPGSQRIRALSRQ